jgi:hypothetical protein
MAEVAKNTGLAHVGNFRFSGRFMTAESIAMARNESGARPTPFVACWLRMVPLVN